jgi:transposase
MKPIHTIKDKGLSVAIWETRNGGYSFSISKRYKDKQSDEWKDSKYLFKNDVETLIIQLQAALEFEKEKTGQSSNPVSQKASNMTNVVDVLDMDDLPF